MVVAWILVVAGLAYVLCESPIRTLDLSPYESAVRILGVTRRSNSNLHFEPNACVNWRRLMSNL